MEKVILTAEQAEALEYVRKEYGYGFREFMAVLSTDNFRTIKQGRPLNTMPIENVAAALLLGYEIEKTPEERVMELYESYGGSPSAIERKEGIRETLTIFEIQIEGVNA